MHQVFGGLKKVQRGDRYTNACRQRRALGLLSALVLALVGACETVSLDEPSEVAPEVAARSDEPSTEPVVQVVEASAMAGALNELSPLSDTAGALAAPEIFRGTGVLARRPARRAADIAFEHRGHPIVDGLALSHPH